MEALFDPAFVQEANVSRRLPSADGLSYLAQPEMRELIQAALDLNWTLLGYEADVDSAPSEWEPLSNEFTNWREEEQARNLAGELETLPPDTKVLVWCGNGHLNKRTTEMRTWTWVPMGWHLRHITHIEPFAIDQTVTVTLDPSAAPDERTAIAALAPLLEEFGRTAGFLTEEAPEPWCRDGVDAVLLSLDNEMSKAGRP